MIIKKGFNPRDVFKTIYQALEIFPDGVNMLLEAKDKEKRSNPQNNYYWLVCASISSFLNDSGVSYKKITYAENTFDIEWNQDDVHNINKKVFGVKTTKGLSIKEFTEYMEKVFSLWIEKTKGNWEVPIPITEYFNDYI